ncbi:MAG: hypothetical protein GY795_13715 [Desulfobacterales bacterium]|nr:hypothetical protein [Desulfobacterales bacterium]
MKEIEKGNVTRYCKPSALDENGSPTSSAFQRRPDRKEGYLSVYLLDYFNNSEQRKDISQVKKIMEKNRFNLKKSALFAVLNIEQSKKYIMEEISELISYKELNLPHSGIFHEYDDLVISELLAECVQSTYAVRDIE